MSKPTNKHADNHKKLSILVAQDGLSFCVSSADKIKSFFKEDFSEPQSPESLLQEILSFFSYKIEKEDLETITEVKVFYAHHLYSLVPHPYFDENNLSDYLKFNIKLLSTDEISFDNLNHINAHLVYVPYTNINNFLFDKFGEFTYQHSITHFIDSCKMAAKPHEISVFVNVFSLHFDLCIFENQDLLICNSYDYHYPEDFVYYLLFALEQLNLDREKLQLYLSGKIDKSSDLYKMLKDYIKNIEFFGNQPSLTIEDWNLKEALPHQHHFLLNTI